MTSPMTSAIPTESSSSEQSNHIRFVGLGVYIVLMIVELWIIISLTHFGIKTRKWRRLQSKNPDLLSSGKIYLSVVFCYVSALVYHIVVAMYRNYEYGYQLGEDEFCNTIRDMSVIMYTMCSFSVGLFLWLRQRMFYTAFLQTVHFSKALKVFSFMIIFIAIFGLVSGLVLSILPYDFIASPIGCIRSRSSNFRVPALVILVFTVIFSQVALLSVFIHALLASYRSAGTPKSLFCCQLKSSVEEGNVTTNPCDRTRAIVENVIRKTIIFAALSLLSDLLVAFGSVYLIQPGGRRDTILLLSALSVSMNSSFVIFSFIPWRNMIASPCRSYTHNGMNTANTNRPQSR